MPDVILVVVIWVFNVRLNTAELLCLAVESRLTLIKAMIKIKLVDFHLKVFKHLLNPVEIERLNFTKLFTIKELKHLFVVL
jgi:hypothetical protein